MSLTLDIDNLVKEPNYDPFTGIAYSAGATTKPVWSVPDDEIAITPMLEIDSGDAGRTMTNIYIAEDDTLSRSINLKPSQAASRYINYEPGDGTSWHDLIWYPGETVAVLFAANAAGGTFGGYIRYIRLKTIEVPL